MKTLFFILSFLFVSLGYSQVFTITAQRGLTIVKSGNVKYTDVLSKPDGGSPEEVLYSKYVIDVTKKTSSYYEYNKLVSVLPFDSVSTKDGIITINLTDYALANPTITFNTTMVLNTNVGSENLIWYYYNKTKNVTLVQKLLVYQCKKTTK